jgi:hypothetical protein
MFGWGKNERGSNAQKSGESGKPNSQAMPTVKFDSAKVTETIKADLRQNIKSLTEVAPNDFDMIYEAALHSISAGRALDILYQALMTIKGMNKRRAVEISRSLNDKATALITVEKQKQSGIKYAIWRYSGAPCESVDSAHKAADGKPYLVAKRMLLNGQWTWPAREEGCKCTPRPMIVGFDDYTGGKPKGYLE